MKPVFVFLFWIMLCMMIVHAMLARFGYVSVSNEDLYVAILEIGLIILLYKYVK